MSDQGVQMIVKKKKANNDEIYKKQEVVESH